MAMSDKSHNNSKLDVGHKLSSFKPQKDAGSLQQGTSGCDVGQCGVECL